MPRDTRNVGASVRARLLARSRAENADYQILLTRYVLERLLYRLSVSEHRERFILKGALLFVTWVADPGRLITAKPRRCSHSAICLLSADWLIDR
jgi:hypothetical protein